MLDLLVWCLDQVLNLIIWVNPETHSLGSARGMFNVLINLTDAFVKKLKDIKTVNTYEHLTTYQDTEP